MEFWTNNSTNILNFRFDSEPETQQKKDTVTYIIIITKQEAFVSFEFIIT